MLKITVLLSLKSLDGRMGLDKQPLVLLELGVHLLQLDFHLNVLAIRRSI